MKIRRGGRPLFLAASLFLFGPWLYPAAAQLLGPELQLNSYTTGVQQLPAVAADGAGNFVVVWESTGQDLSNLGVFGQRFDSAGSKVGSEFQVNTYTTDDQGQPAVAVDGSGNFVVVWYSFAQDGSVGGVFGQRFDSGGNLAGSEFQVNTYTTSYQYFPAVAADGPGNFVVVWQSNGGDGESYGVSGQRFDSAGSTVGSEFQVNTYTTSAQDEPAVAADGAGNFVVVWESTGQDLSTRGVFGQRFDTAGSTVGSEFQVNSYTTSSQGSPAVAADGSGNFVVVWDGAGSQDGEYSGVLGQRFDSAGSKLGSEFQVNTYTTSYQVRAAVAADGSGNFVVAWHAGFDQDGSIAGVFGQQFDSAGSKVGSEFQVNTYTTDRQWFPALATDGSGNFVVAWRGGFNQDGSLDGVFGRQLTVSIFSDDFDLGDSCAWSASVGGGC